MTHSIGSMEPHKMTSLKFLVDCYNDCAPTTTRVNKIDFRSIPGTFVHTNGNSIMFSDQCVWRLQTVRAVMTDKRSTRSSNPKQIPVLNHTDILRLFRKNILAHLIAYEHETETAFVTSVSSSVATVVYELSFRKFLVQKGDGSFVFEACIVCYNQHVTQMCCCCCTVRYCSSGCQSADWQNHKKMCAAFVKNRSRIVNKTMCFP